MQRNQSKILRMITNAPWYVTNQTLHEDLNVLYITEVIQERSNKHHDKIKIHSMYYLMAPTRATTQKKIKKILASRPN
jgi:hypothetical protein